MNKERAFDILNTFNITAKLTGFETYFVHYGNIFRLKIGKFAYDDITIQIDLQSNTIFYDSDLNFYNEEACKKTFGKLDCMPQRIDWIANWRNKTDMYRVSHVLRLTNKNIERLNRVYLYVLDSWEKM